MIYSVRGNLLAKESNFVVVECCGVGYKVYVSTPTLATLNFGEVTLFTYMNVTENGVDLFGFEDKKELDVFKMLISVSGVGPKVGIGILSYMTADSAVLAIASGDSKALTKCSGVGAKLAARIVLELKDKLGDKEIKTAVTGSDIPGRVVSSSNHGEAVSALVALGCSQSEAYEALQGADSNSSVDDLIKFGLKKLSAK